MRPTRCRHDPASTALILARAQEVLATTRRAWLVATCVVAHGGAPGVASGHPLREPQRPESQPYGEDVAARATADDDGDPSAGLHPPPAPASQGDAFARRRTAVARLVTRVYRHANAPLRADMLACLLRPLGTLSLVGVASGAFAVLLERDGAAPVRVPIELAVRFSSDQILELAQFVHEVSPGTLDQLVTLLADGALGATALSASALVLLYRKLRGTPRPSPV